MAAAARILRVVVLGVVLLAFGLAFALAPIPIARVMGNFRFVPYPSSPSGHQMRYFRLAGLAIAVVGVILILVI
jgi:hypothetical protein